MLTAVKRPLRRSQQPLVQPSRVLKCFHRQAGIVPALVYVLKIKLIVFFYIFHLFSILLNNYSADLRSRRDSSYHGVTISKVPGTIPGRDNVEANFSFFPITTTQVL